MTAVSVSLVVCRCVYLSGGLLHKAFIGELEGPAEGLAGILAEGFLVSQVDVQVVGSINGSVDAAVAIEHCKVSLFFLILQDKTGHMTLLTLNTFLN